MKIRLRDLTSLHVADADGAHHAVIDLLVRHDTPDITHVITRLGRWLDRQGCAMRIDAFGTPDLGARLWPARVTEDDVRGAGHGGPVAVVCGADAVPDPADVAAAEGIGALAALSDLDNRPVLAADGAQVGTVMDMVIDVDAARVSALIVRAGGPGDNAHQRVVPVDLFAAIDWTAAQVQLRCGAGDVADAPDLHEVGAEIDGHWWNKALAYYGIG